MTIELIRMVMRVPRDLPEKLTTIQTHLFDETRIEYPFAAIVRGLISMGLERIEGKPNIAVEFAGTRVPRGRKAGSGKAIPTLDLTKDDVDPAATSTVSNWERREEERKRDIIQRFDDIADAVDAAEARKAKRGDDS